MKDGLYTRREVACIIADLFGGTCACDYSGNDEWLPHYCEFADNTVAFEMAIDALEKQVQKKPTKTKIATLNKSPEAISWESIHCCPRCESNLAPQYKYCPQCGLEIDWSDRDD